MNNKKQTKKKSKYNKLKVSPLIPIIAVIEIALLICVCTYAWYAVTVSKTAMSDLIKVDPDSGLEIDFADTDDGKIYINDYIKNFTFEPATSLDGRNIFFPTTGTFANAANTSASDMAQTNKMTFREGTINDINSKYINIDFALTNTGEEAIPVYLSSKSKFEVYKNGVAQNSSALRFAFYKNDGEPGDTDGPFTIYFDNSFSGAPQPYIYLWTMDTEGNADKNAEWPGVPMVKYNESGIYSYTFDNDSYANLIINNGKESTATVANQTVDIKCSDVHNGDLFALGTTTIVGGKKCYNYSASASGFTPPSGYAVIAPGTSTGFTRYYEPVLEINNNTGVPAAVTPAYAGAFDDYLYHKQIVGEETEDRSMFTIDAGEKVSLSLVVWLEGTDKGCVAENYAGCDIKIDFLFATEKAGADNLFRYNFYDRTLETWVRNTGVSKTGNLVKPVVMLYDNQDKKGYLMYNDSRHPELWYCDAPDYVCTHDIIFRRVNPADETDVWNWWEAGKCANMEQGSTKYVDKNSIMYTATNGGTTISDPNYDSGGHLIGATVNFTAFGDSGLYDTTAGDTSHTVWTHSNLHSCGGAWGNHTTSEFCVVDGTQNTWFDNDNGTMTMRYDLGGQHIEYKGSPFRGSVYRFSIPAILTTNSSTYKLNIGRYYNYMDNLSALEDPNDNPNLKYDTLIVSGKAYGGTCYQIVDSFNGSRWDYFGNEILYLQINKGEGYHDNAPYDGGAVFRIHFKEKNSSNNMYVQCRRDSAVSYSADGEDYNSFDTYPRVVPYANCEFTVKRMNPNNPEQDSGQWNTTASYNFERSKRRFQLNTADCTSSINLGEVDGWPIPTAKITVYFTNNLGWSGTPKAYYWSGGSDWPGTSMTFVKNNDYGQPIYKVQIPKAAGGVVFNDNNNGHQTVDITIDSLEDNTKLEDGYQYYPAGGTDSDNKYKVERTKYK
ncbi:MAG: starch-binding protein [Oscillospiraceae bacterium]|nr:starch-binding protein [Candidatus Ruminococcus equi]